MKSPEEIAEGIICGRDNSNCYPNGLCSLCESEWRAIAAAIREERERAEKAERERDVFRGVAETIADLRREFLEMIRGKDRTSITIHNQRVETAYLDLFDAIRAWKETHP